METGDWFGKIVKVMIDRPLGSKHPQYDLMYPLNYGFIPETQAGDGMEIDVYVLGIFEPVQTAEVEIIALVHRQDDCEQKLVGVPPEKDYTREQIQALIEFQERFFQSTIIMKERKVVTLGN